MLKLNLLSLFHPSDWFELDGDQEFLDIRELTFPVFLKSQTLNTVLI